MLSPPIKYTPVAVHLHYTATGVVCQDIYHFFEQKCPSYTQKAVIFGIALTHHVRRQGLL